MLVTLLAVAATAVSATSYNFHKGPKTEVFDVNLDGQADGPQPGAKPIYYQSYGARVIDQPANINLIWYGNWTQSQRGIINDFLDNLGYNDWYAVNQRYYQAASRNWDPIFQGCYGKVQPACTPATNGSYCDVNNPCCLKFGCNC
eukprot:jgi/Hompol1/1000/HPOL_005485-RA